MSGSTDETGFAVEEVAATPADPPQPARRKRRTKAEMEAADMGGENGSAPEAADTGPKRRKSKASTKDRETTWAHNIQGAYALFAVGTNAPFMMLKDEEAKQLGHGCLVVAEEFGLLEFEDVGKWGAVIGLVVAAVTVNVPRAWMFRQHLQMVRSSRIVSNPEPSQPYTNNAPVDPNQHVYDTMPKVEPGQPIH